VKADAGRFGSRLVERGCGVEPHDDLLVVKLPGGTSSDLLWEVAASSGEQIRYLRPQRSTLEEVFLKAVEGGAV
jgi:ABC-2 type transport system ATP-binding protein